MQQCRWHCSALSLRNEPERVDRVRVEYRDPNDAGVSPALAPALLLANLGHWVLADSLQAIASKQ
jgi:hypothetical protein